MKIRSFKLAIIYCLLITNLLSCKKGMDPYENPVLLIPSNSAAVFSIDMGRMSEKADFEMLKSSPIYKMAAFLINGYGFSEITEDLNNSGLEFKKKMSGYLSKTGPDSLNMINFMIPVIDRVKFEGLVGDKMGMDIIKEGDKSVMDLGKTLVCWNDKLLVVSMAMDDQQVDRTIVTNEAFRPKGEDGLSQKMPAMKDFFLKENDLSIWMHPDDYLQDLGMKKDLEEIFQPDILNAMDYWYSINFNEGNMRLSFDYETHNEKSRVAMQEFLSNRMDREMLNILPEKVIGIMSLSMKPDAYDLVFRPDALKDIIDGLKEGSVTGIDDFSSEESRQDSSRVKTTDHMFDIFKFSAKHLLENAEGDLLIAFSDISENKGQVYPEFTASLAMKNADGIEPVMKMMIDSGLVVKEGTWYRTTEAEIPGFIIPRGSFVQITNSEKLRDDILNGDKYDPELPGKVRDNVMQKPLSLYLSVESLMQILANMQNVDDLADELSVSLDFVDGYFGPMEGNRGSAEFTLHFKDQNENSLNTLLRALVFGMNSLFNNFM